MQKRGYFLIAVLFLITVFLGYFYSSMMIGSEAERSNQNEAWELYQERDFQNAITLFEKYHEKDSTNFYALTGLGWSYFELGNYAQAILYFNEADSLQPDDFEVAMGLGLSYYFTNVGKKTVDLDFTEAKVYLEKATSISQRRSALLGIYYLLGTIYEFETRYLGKDTLNQNQPGDYFARSLDFDPVSPYSLSGLGLANYRANNYDEAIKQFEKAILIDPSNTAAYSGLAFVYYDLDDFEKALQLHTKAVELDPSPLNYNRQALAYLYLGDTESALATVDKAIELVPTEARYHDSKAIILYVSGRFEEAILSLEQSTTLHNQYGSDSPFGLVLGKSLMGWSYYRLNQKTTAQDLFEDVLENESGSFTRFLSYLGIITILSESNNEASAYTSELEDLLLTADYLDHIPNAGKVKLCLEERVPFSSQDVYDCASFYRTV